ncbi:sodium channel protein Nach [Drosophila subobscura]|uniref:sodium channel protein Nach n=1 Tax=Drosophila subobscura TaxID=7241 RepID=UPI00155A0C13|nr:sodium channel protein Nach [Drosophila subobscura]
MSSRLAAAFNRTVVEYFRKTSLNGFGLLYFIRKRRVQRLFWFSFICCGLFFAGYSVFAMILDLLDSSTITDLSERDSGEKGALPLPSIEICSGYRFSKRKMQEYTQMLANSSGKSLGYWWQKMHLLEGYMDPLAVDAEEAKELQESLGFRDVRSHLLNLTPACVSLILKCQQNRVTIDCSEIFQLQATNYGHCCVLRDRNITGELSLSLDTSQEDEFPMEKSRRLAGFHLHISSWLGRVTIGQGEKSLVEVNVMELEANSELREYPVDRRGCHFPHEGEGREKCLQNCRLKASLMNCQCVPYPFERDAKLKQKYCTLEDIACLQMVEVNWSPNQCQQCLPLCNQMLHSLHKSLLGFMHPFRSSLMLRFRTSRWSNYAQDKHYHWYHILSNIGGVLGICIGCSLISGFELINFMVFRFWSNFRQQPQQE